MECVHTEGLKITRNEPIGRERMDEINLPSTKRLTDELNIADNIMSNSLHLL